jgi:two-component system, sensor histidine kinase and response regulator
VNDASPVAGVVQKAGPRFLTQTLARRLLYTLLPWYLLLAFCVTSIQLAMEYYTVSSDVAADLASLGRTVEPGVTEAVWELDNMRLASVARGIRQNAIVTGLQIADEKGRTIVADGNIPAAPPQEAGIFRIRDRRETVPLLHQSRDGKPQPIGLMVLHSSDEVVWQRMKYGFFLVLVNSVIEGAGLWLILSWTVRFRLSRNVTEVARIVATWKFKPGDAPVKPIAYPYQDELGRLVNALNESQARLLESIRELNDMNVNLESCIAERTWELRQAKDAAESADRLKSAFLATMSHELRTPLNSIIGFTGIVLQGLAGPLNDEQATQLGMVRDSSRHLLALINDVLDISKIEAGQLKVAAVPFDLAASIRKVAAIVGPLADKKGLELSVRVADGVGPMVGDARRVEQVMLNLLGNAIKFTDTGSVKLEVAPADDFVPAGFAAQPAVRLTVTDTGIGIKPEDEALLFAPFRQVESDLSRHHEGTGLGLAICKKLVELMGGMIKVESKWQQGSVFSVTLPLKPSPEDGPAGLARDSRRSLALSVEKFLKAGQGEKNS